VFVRKLLHFYPHFPIQHPHFTRFVVLEDVPVRRRTHSRARANHVAGVDPEDARRILRAARVHGPLVVVYFPFTSISLSFTACPHLVHKWRIFPVRRCQTIIAYWNKIELLEESARFVGVGIRKQSRAVPFDNV